MPSLPRSQAEHELADERHARAWWLALDPDPALVFLHLPPSDLSSGTAVLMCPPFGWEEMCSYRARRIWADALAGAGHATARITFPSSGDSAGEPGDPDRIRSWTGAISGAAQWLRETTGAARVVAIGIGLGGLIACEAVSEGAVIDDLILWAVPARGRDLVRELRTYAGMVAARRPEDRRAETHEAGDAEYIGFLLTGESCSSLERLDLTATPVPSGERRRALLLGRDGLPFDKRLREHLGSAGVAVTVEDTRDYAAMMLHPQESEPPRATIGTTLAWLSPPSAPAPKAAPPPVASTTAPAALPSIELRWGGAVVRETAIEFEAERGRLFGILSEGVDIDAAPVCAVWLNGGALPHVGPNRAWVETARRWAARGVPTVRVDLYGIGDAEGEDAGVLCNPALYTPTRTRESLAVIDQLAKRGLAEHFVLGGLCSGAYWSLHAALSDERVAGLMLINLYAFFWSEALVAERETRDSLEALRGYGWRRLARRDVRAERLKAAIASIRPARLRAGSGHPVERAQISKIEAALDRLRDQRTETLLLLSRAEGLHDQLSRFGVLNQLDRWPNLSAQRIPSTDHMFRALWLQRHVHQCLDAALERVLSSVATRS